MIQPSGPGGAAQPTPAPVPLAALLLTLPALAIAFWGLHHLDVPIARFVRSLHNWYGVLDLPWLAFVSQAGDWIGEGWHLVVFSVSLAIVGWRLTLPALYRAGVDSLLAHGLAALLVNGLKHLIGRARPKFMHGGNEHTAPFLGSGWDSFPSGHTTASFAVAAVVARQVPCIGPALYMIAAFVALSRVLRAAHFPSDVGAGVLLGFLCAALFAHPLKDWRTSLSHAAVAIAPYFVGIFAVLWALTHPVFDPSGRIVSWVGFLVLAAGVFGRERRWVWRKPRGRGFTTAAGNVCIALGLALITGSLLVVLATGLVSAALWLQWVTTAAQEKESPIGSVGYGGLVREGFVLLGLAAAVLVIYGMQGAVPLS